MSHKPAPPKSLGQRIRDVREGKKVSQLSLAHKMGYKGENAGAVISNIEAGRRRPRIDTIQRIALALEVHLQELV